MANGHGGRRAGAGAKPKATGFRAWCREVVLSPEVQKVIKDQALASAEFALKVAEHGFGRPGQALDVKVRGDQDAPLRFAFPGDVPVPPTATGLPDTRGGEHGEG